MQCVRRVLGQEVHPENHFWGFVGTCSAFAAPTRCQGGTLSAMPWHALHLVPTVNAKSTNLSEKPGFLASAAPEELCTWSHYTFLGSLHSIDLRGAFQGSPDRHQSMLSHHGVQDHHHSQLVALYSTVSSNVKRLRFGFSSVLGNLPNKEPEHAMTMVGLPA